MEEAAATEGAEGAKGVLRGGQENVREASSITKAKRNKTTKRSENKKVGCEERVQH